MTTLLLAGQRLADTVWRGIMVLVSVVCVFSKNAVYTNVKASGAA